MAAPALCLGIVCAPGDPARAQDVFVYPTRNQTDEQMARDKEECHDWAVKQTGVDPVTMAAAQPSASGQQSGSGGGAAGGAAMGAARGAMSGDAAAGAARGVGIGRLVHAIRARRQMEEQQDAQVKQQQQVQAQLQKYDRAFGACLTGRGYTVQ
jgi:predicted lipid-binding transport protein (Tim44 family)